ncbi:hypothetical protein, partial [Seonamhaeicola marinus]
MLSSRISEEAQKPDAAFLGASVGYQSLARANNAFSMRVAPKPGQQEAAFKAVLTEVVRAVKFGFTPSE